jgi:hypothetical protein
VRYQESKTEIVAARTTLHRQLLSCLTIFLLPVFLTTVKPRVSFGGADDPRQAQEDVSLHGIRQFAPKIITKPESKNGESEKLSPFSFSTALYAIEFRYSSAFRQNLLTSRHPHDPSGFLSIRSPPAEPRPSRFKISALILVS